MNPTLLNRQTETLLYQPVVPGPDTVRLGWLYPASYAISVSSLGYLALFRQMDTDPAFDAVRVSLDDLHRYQAQDFELAGFSFSFELDILNILKSLDTLNIPFYAADRNQSHPLIFAGGPVVMANPEPYADFFDFFLVGEGEDLLRDLGQAFRKYRHLQNRQDLLKVLALEVPGLYVPSLYEVSYESPSGPVTHITPISTDLPARIEKRVTTNLDTEISASPILSPESLFPDKFLVEVMRGCAHRCRFCLASYTMLAPRLAPRLAPVSEGATALGARGPSFNELTAAIDRGLEHTSKIGLLGALIADHPDFPALCEHLDRHLDARPELEISVSSLRADTLTPRILNVLKRGKLNQVTIAVESGSERLRRRINKNLKHGEILQAAQMTAEAGIRSLKLYGMVGLPDETDEDVLALASLLQEIRRENPKLSLVLGCSSFVPKAGTPFQWMPRPENRVLDQRFNLLKKALLKTAKFRPSSTKWDTVQAWVSRGDRRLAPLLVRLYELGGTLGAVNRAYKDHMTEGGRPIPSLDWYANRERPASEILPWEHLFLGVPKEVLYKEGLPPVSLEV